jgi:hypothetical protein
MPIKTLIRNPNQFALKAARGNSMFVSCCQQDSISISVESKCYAPNTTAGIEA